MDNQKPVLQIRPYSSNGHYAAIVICVAIILVSAFCQAFHYFYATLFVFAFLLLVLFIHFNDIKKARTINFINYYKVDYYFCASMILISIALLGVSPYFSAILLVFGFLFFILSAKKITKETQKTNIMNFYDDGKIEYNNEIYNAKDYLGITTINNDDTLQILRRYVSCNYVVLISKDKFANNNLYVFEIPMYLNEIELGEVVQLKKNIANIIHLPIFHSCEGFVLRDNLTIWQEENIDHLILYNQHKSNQIEIILYCCFFAWFTFSAFSNYHLSLTIIASILSFVSCYLLFDKYRFYHIFFCNPFDIVQLQINNGKFLYKNKEIAFNNIKQIKIKDIYSQNKIHDIYAQKYYVYSRLNIELNNGKKIKLFVSTPQVRNPEKLRQFLSEKLPNKLIDEDKIS